MDHTSERHARSQKKGSMYAGVQKRRHSRTRERRAEEEAESEEVDENEQQGGPQASNVSVHTHVP